MQSLTTGSFFGTPCKEPFSKNPVQNRRRNPAKSSIVDLFCIFITVHCHIMLLVYCYIVMLSYNGLYRYHIVIFSDYHITLSLIAIEYVVIFWCYRIDILSCCHLLFCYHIVTLLYCCIIM